MLARVADTVTVPCRHGVAHRSSAAVEPAVRPDHIEHRDDRAPLAAGAQDADLDDARRQVQEQQSGLNGQIDATRAADEEVSAALSAVGDELEHQRLRVEDTERASRTPRTRSPPHESGRRGQAAKERAAGQLREAAVDSYVRPPLDAQIDQLFTVEPGHSEVRAALARSAVRTTADALDQMRAAQQDLERAEARAAAAELEAREQHVDAEARLVELDLAHAPAGRPGRRRRDPPRPPPQRSGRTGSPRRRPGRADHPAPSRPCRPGRRRGRCRPGRGGRHQPTSTRPAASPRCLAYRSSGNVALATVGGIEVAAEIADQLGRMLAAAAADGITLEGGGWRSSDEQIAIRMEVCGTSDYAIWEMPSWECSPPVARPGRSMHEQGLAIDFTADGDLIRSRSDPAFVWLANNAERFGFYNLPSEPWHWSTTGS